nr:hypothetical protein CFP56_53915 [Quercus suber]
MDNRGLQVDHEVSSGRERAAGQDRERFPADNKISTTKGGPQFSLSMNMTRVIETVKRNPFVIAIASFIVTV